MLGQHVVTRAQNSAIPLIWACGSQTKALQNCDFGEAQGHYATLKYDANGNAIWAARYDGPGNGPDYAGAIAVDQSGNVYVTGGSTGTGGSLDYTTIKYDSAGNQLWVARYDGPASRDDVAVGLAVSASGNVYVTGFSVGIHTNDFPAFSARTKSAPDQRQWKSVSQGIADDAVWHRHATQRSRSPQDQRHR